MNRFIIIESLSFAIHKSQMNMLVNGESVESMHEYTKFKSVYKNFRIHSKCNKVIFLDSLNMFKEHLQSRIESAGDIKEALLTKINIIENQIDYLIKNEI